MHIVEHADLCALRMLKTLWVKILCVVARFCFMDYMIKGRVCWNAISVHAPLDWKYELHVEIWEL